MFQNHKGKLVIIDMANNIFCQGPSDAIDLKYFYYLVNDQVHL